MEGGSADVADEEAGADADATDEAPSTAPTIPRADADSAEEGGVGEVDNDAEVAEFDVPVAALVGFPPFFFVMGWCVGVLEVGCAVSGVSTASVPHTRRQRSARGEGRGAEGKMATEPIEANTDPRRWRGTRDDDAHNDDGRRAYSTRR